MCRTSISNDLTFVGLVCINRYTRSQKLYIGWRVDKCLDHLIKALRYYENTVCLLETWLKGHLVVYGKGGISFAGIRSVMGSLWSICSVRRDVSDAGIANKIWKWRLTLIHWYPKHIISHVLFEGFQLELVSLCFHLP